MTGRLPTLVTGIVIALLGVAGFQWVLKVGWFQADKPLEQVVRENTNRAGLFLAQQKEQEFKKILADAERSGRLDVEAYRKAIAGAGEHANMLTSSFENWKKANPQISADIPGAIPPQSFPAPASQSMRGPAEAQRPSPSPEASVPKNASFVVVDGFFDDVFQVRGGGTTWMRIPRDLDRPFGLSVSGTLTTDFQTTDQRNTVGPRGLAHSVLPRSPAGILATMPNPSNGSLAALLNDRDRTTFEASLLSAPDLPFAAVIARYCTVDGCEQPFIPKTNPLTVCPRPSAWIEFRTNEFVRRNDWASVHHVEGAFVLRPVRISLTACGTERETPSLSSKLDVPPSNDSFFGSRFEFTGYGGARWLRVKRSLSAPFAFQISGEFNAAQPEWFTKTGRTTFGFRGIPYNELNVDRYVGIQKGKGALDLPDANYFALIGRFCDLDGCDPPFVISENPYVICTRPGKWVELKINESDELTRSPSYRADGAIVATPIRLSAANACSS
jgi:hypothetical protein